MSDEDQNNSGSSSSSSSSPSSSSSTLVPSPHSQDSQSSNSRTLTPGNANTPKNKSPTDHASNYYSTPQSSLDEAATLRRSPYVTPSPVPTPSEIAFDEMYREYLEQELKSKPPFVPVVYNSTDEPPIKFRRLIARGHEKDLKEKLVESGLTEYQIDEYARNAAYCPGLPGSKHQPVDRVFGYSWSPKISLTSSEGDASPRYLFKDLPAELPKEKKKISSLVSVYEPEALKTPERIPSALVFPQTPNRKTMADTGHKAPVTSIMNVDIADHLSPVFDGLKLRRKKKFSKDKTLESSVLPSYKVPVHAPVGLFSPVNAAEDAVVPFTQNSPVIPVDAIEIRISQPADLPNGHADQPEEEQEITTEPVSSSLLSSKESLSSRKSSYKSSTPIILLVTKSVMLKYPQTLEYFAELFNIEIVDGPFEQRVTHVIYDESSIEISLEYIQAVGFGKYLINLSWITDCIDGKKLIDPALYEAVINALSQDPPSRASRNSVGRLLRNFAFLCADPFIYRIKRNQLVQLLVFNDGTILFEPREFTEHEDKIRICIVGELEFYGKEENREQLRRKLKKYNCVKVHYSWIFHVFATYSLQPLTNYLFDSTIEEARIAGVPEELLE